MSSVFRDFFLLYVCSLLLNGIFTDCKWFFREESGILLQNLEGKNTAFHQYNAIINEILHLITKRARFFRLLILK